MGKGIRWLVLGFAAAAWAGCDGGALDAGAGTAQDFTLQYCQTGDECRDGNACLPMGDAATGRGICLPPPPADGGAGGATDPATGEGGAATCFAETWGDPATCQPGVDWALRAVDSCKARGATLVDLHVLLSCDGLPGGAVFTCCAFGDVPVEPPPPPPPQECVTMAFPGWAPDGSMPDPKQMAFEQCRAMGLELRDLRPLDQDPATGMAMTWEAVCCGGTTPPEPPPPQACVEMPFPADPNVDPKEMAWRLCSGQNLVLAEVKPLDMDAAGQVFTWLAVCCGGDVPVEPPPPDPGACTRIPVRADPTNPDPYYGDPKMAAYEQCRAMGLELVDLQPGAADSTGMVREWIATCCGPVTPPEPPPPQACVEMPFPGDGSVDPREMARRLCADQNLALVDVKPLDMDAAGQVFTWLAVCCGGDVPVEPPPPDPGACTQVRVKADPYNPDPAYSDPKMAAYEQCRAMGLELVDLQPGEADAAGNAWLWVATCCGGPVEPPPPPPEQCLEMAMPFDCLSGGDWKTPVYERCAAAGGEVRDLKVSDCAADGQGVVYANCCIGTVEPPPVGETCTRIGIPADATDAAADPKMLAYEQCKVLGLDLRDLQPRGMDDAGVVHGWIATCCGPATEPPVDPEPPVEPGCAIPAVLPIGDGTCDAAFDWKGEADLQCRILGGFLADLRIRHACDDGSIGAVIATCCLDAARVP